MMRRHAARLIDAARQRAGYSVPELAVRLGRSNMGKFAARWDRRAENYALLDECARALSVSAPALALAEDLNSREEAKRFAAEARAIQPHVIVRLMPAVYRKIKLEPGISGVDAELAAGVIAREHDLPVILSLQTQNIWLDAKGCVLAVRERGVNSSPPCSDGLRVS